MCNGGGSTGGFGSHMSTMTLNQLPGVISAASSSATSSTNNYATSSRSYTYSLAHTSTVTLNNMSMTGAANSSIANSSSMYMSTTNLNFNDEAQIEKTEFMQLLVRGIASVKCVSEVSNCLCLSYSKVLILLSFNPKINLLGILFPFLD